MTPADVHSRIGKIPYMQEADARVFYDLITQWRLRDGLELGFFHGASTAYIAGALAEVPGGCLTTIDLCRARARVPNVEQTLERAGLTRLVTVFYEPVSYNWRLMRLLEDPGEESLDFCYFDGGHTWHATGFAFCLVSKLLRPGGWAAFDDLQFTYSASRCAGEPWLRSMPEEERRTPQILKVFELLVERDPAFGNFRRLRRLAFAQKLRHAWSGCEPHAMELEILAGRAMARASVDPDFRLNLLSDPVAALGESPSVSAVPGGIRFELGPNGKPIFAREQAGGVTTFFLPRSPFGRRRTEAEMEAMLRAMCLTAPGKTGSAPERSGNDPKRGKAECGAQSSRS